MYCMILSILKALKRMGDAAAGKYAESISEEGTGPFLRGGAFLSPRLINNHLSPLDITILYLLITMLLERSYWKNIQLTSHNIKKPAPVFVSGAGSHSPGKRDFGCQAVTIFR